MAGSSQGKKSLELAGRMFATRQPWDQLAQELSYYFAPHLAEFTEEIYLGEEFSRHISDPVPLIMARDLGDAFGTMLRSDEWFKVTIDDEDIAERQHVAEFLDMMTETTRNMLYDRRAGFTRMAKEHEHTFAIFGVGTSSAILDISRPGFVFQNWHPKSIAYSLNSSGHADRLARKTKPEAHQIMDFFDGRPNTNIPQFIRNIAKNKPDEKIEIHHVVTPRDMYDTQTRDFPKNARYASCYVTGDGDIIQETPEFEFPYMISRWRTVDSWGPYPFSPATMSGLPHARMLQRAMYSFIEAGEKAVDPPLIATSEAISSPIDITAGGITWVDDKYDERMGAPLVPLQLGKNPQLGDRLLNQFHGLMAEAMFISKLNIPGAAGEGTAYEMSQLIQQNIRQLQPIFEPAQDEIIYRYLERVVDAGIRLGAYGPWEEFPEELQGREITYSFSNPLQRERERRKVAQFGEAAEIAAAGMQLDPTVATEFDVSRWVRDAMKGSGAPADWLNSVEEAMAAKQAMIQAQQEQQQMMAMQQGAEAMGTGAQAAIEMQKLLAGPEGAAA